MNNYLTLNAPELVKLFAKVVDGHVILGRDSHMLRMKMDEHGWESPQVVLGFYTWRSLGGAKDIPTFISCFDRWLVADSLEANAELAHLIGGGPIPPFFIVYLDLRDTGVLDARMEQMFNDAKAQLIEYATRRLNRTPHTRDIRAGTAVGSVRRPR